MQLLTILLSVMLIALAAPMVRAGPAGALVVSDKIPPGYKLGKMGFHGTIAGHEITYNGTIEEILAHAETLYPGVTKALAARDDTPLLEITELSSPNIATRDANAWKYGGPSDGKGHRYCGKDCPLCKNWGYAQNRRIQEGINYLNKVTATCNTDGKTCVRISCSWHAGIYLCNDFNEHFEAPCNWISTFASDIIGDDNCQDPANSHWTYDQSKGQQWAGNKPYNVYVAWAYC